MQALTAAGQVVGRETIDCDSQTRKCTGGQGWVRRAGSWTEPHLEPAVEKWSDVRMHREALAGEKSRWECDGERMEERDKNHSIGRLGGNPSRTTRRWTKTEGTRERESGKDGVWRFSAGKTLSS